MIRRLVLILVGTTIIAALGAGTYVGVRAAYGAFRDYTYLTVTLDRAGQQVQIGTDVRVRGVNIGRVSDIRLVDRKAVLTLQIDAHNEISKTAEAVVSLKTFLGSKFVDLRYDPRIPAEKLADGDSIATARVGPELEDALDDGTHILDVVDSEKLALIVSELARAGRGHADDIARGLTAQAELTTTFAETTREQIASLRDFDTLFESLADRGSDLNDLAAATNEAVPVLASDEAQRDLARALDAVVPFADDLADILIVERENLRRMYNSGDRVMQVIADNSDGLGDLVHGLYRYLFKLGGAIVPNLIFDESATAGFTNFIGGNDQEEEFRQLCTALPPEVRDEVPFCEGTSR